MISCHQKKGVSAMAMDSLQDLITALQYGTRLHISVVFLRNYGNERTRLGFGQSTHKTPVCDRAKATSEGFAACYRCRNRALRLAVKRRRSFGGYCVNGVYEYCRPLVYGEDVAAVIFVGNIRRERSEILRQRFSPELLETMEPEYPVEQCRRAADLLESYIRYLLKTAGTGRKTAFDPLLENMKNYIAENLHSGFSMADMSGVFNYNEKYLGRYFRQKTGKTVREYCNDARMEQALVLLRNTELPIAAIAGQVGYNNVTYFNRLFRAAMGKSPQEYRRQKDGTIVP